ncbi:hypothetical protein SeMB42_g03710 [Synchytrium endobioticum]|uniref:18S rRNA (guanine(1575)-N(7))-methyltransferase Bud23 C-terminal domain-containing protein n=1 Tax=Synchytrium endobioticum TaxID=286115 RepID=A0A507D4F8_9FUNG|nr:hypothetical protein SeLEV6574_g07687 [Synchytrium endobioticum]TPX46372.1 hypothetical protein SeMB42_g03710 [Synchytrium endobioticum]
MSRPEHSAPPEIYYNEAEARKYTTNTRIQSIQAEMTYRAIELLALPQGQVSYLLDIGCGSGLSGECLEEDGHLWVGVDISEAMLHVAVNDRDVKEGDLFLWDIGHGLSFRPGAFDGAISVSVLQWLCNADKSSHNPYTRLSRFFSTLYTSLSRGARAVFQFYPESPDQTDMILTSATRSGFAGGLVVDYPNSTKAKKYYLCLLAGYKGIEHQAPELPKGLDGDGLPETAAYENRRLQQQRDRRKNKKRTGLKDKAWILKKKDAMRNKGLPTSLDSKYTGRKRRPKF